MTNRSNLLLWIIHGLMTFAVWSISIGRVEINPGISKSECAAIVVQSLSALLVSMMTSHGLWQLGIITGLGVVAACCAVLRVDALSDTIALIGLSPTNAMLFHAILKAFVGVPAAVVAAWLGRRMKLRGSVGPQRQ